MTQNTNENATEKGGQTKTKGNRTENSKSKQNENKFKRKQNVEWTRNQKKPLLLYISPKCIASKNDIAKKCTNQTQQRTRNAEANTLAKNHWKSEPQKYKKNIPK